MNDRIQKICACLTRISPEAVGRAASLSRSDQVARRATRGALRSKVARGRAVARGVRNCRGGGRRMRRTSQKWYNMQYVNMSGNLPMGIAGNSPRMRCSAAYPTGRELMLEPRYGCAGESSAFGGDPRRRRARRDRKGPRESVV